MVTSLPARLAVLALAGLLATPAVAMPGRRPAPGGEARPSRRGPVTIARGRLSLGVWRKAAPRVDRMYKQEGQRWQLGTGAQLTVLVTGGFVFGARDWWMGAVEHYSSSGSLSYFHGIVAAVAALGTYALLRVHDIKHQDRVARTVQRALREWNHGGRSSATLVPDERLLRALGDERRLRIAEALIEAEMKIPAVLLRGVPTSGMSEEHARALPAHTD